MSHNLTNQDLFFSERGSLLQIQLVFSLNKMKCPSVQAAVSSVCCHFTAFTTQAQTFTPQCLTSCLSLGTLCLVSYRKGEEQTPAVEPPCPPFRLVNQGCSAFVLSCSLLLLSVQDRAPSAAFPSTPDTETQTESLHTALWLWIIKIPKSGCDASRVRLT